MLAFRIGKQWVKIFTKSSVRLPEICLQEPPGWLAFSLASRAGEALKRFLRKSLSRICSFSQDGLHGIG